MQETLMSLDSANGTKIALEETIAPDKMIIWRKSYKGTLFFG